jgi:hypothetical protein
MGPFFFGERYTWLVFELSFPLERCSAVLMNVSDPLVAAIGNGISIGFEVYSGALEKFKVVRLAFRKVSRYDSLGFLVND